MTAMKVVPSGAEILQRFIKWTCLLDQDGETEFWSDVEWLRKSMLSAVEPAPDGLVEPFGWYYSHPTAIAASHYSHGAQRPDERAGWKPLYAALTSRAAVLEEAAKNDEIEQLKAKAQVCMDLHDALGVKWGEDPYARISALRNWRSA